MWHKIIFLSQYLFIATLCAKMSPVNKALTFFVSLPHSPTQTLTFPVALSLSPSFYFQPRTVSNRHCLFFLTPCLSLIRSLIIILE
jgi:hypothetical protein